MKRRTLLAAAGTAAVGLAGCLGRSSSDSDDGGWSHDVAGWVDSVADGTVHVEEDWQDSDGSVVALDADTGEHLWSYGSTGGYSAYTDLTVGDAVYFGLGDDAVGSGSGELYALEFDGTERWTFDTGSVYERPRFREGTVYVGSDDGVVRAVDADDGSLVWRYEVEPDETGGPPVPQVTSVDDAVYVAAGQLLALDPSSGDRRWAYGDEESDVRGAVVHDGVAYLGNRADVVAVEDGADLWSMNFESPPRVAVDDGRVFVRSGTALLRLDAGDGSKHWTVDVDHLSASTVHGDRVYAAGTELYAFDADDGTEYWSESVAEGLLERVQVAAGGSEDDGFDHAVFVEEGDEAIHRLSPDGEVTWSEQVPGNLRSFVVDDLVYVGTDEGVYAFNPE